MTEVMVALLISSIGLVAVATLFPMSVLQSVRAAQATSATDARLNAESAIDRYEDMIIHPHSRNPLLDSFTNPGNANADPNWIQMQTNGYKNFVVDPLGYARVQTLGWTTDNRNLACMNKPEHFFGNDPNNMLGGAPAGRPWNSLTRYPLSWRTEAAADYLVTLPDSWLLQYETIGGTLGLAANGPAGYTEITLPNLSYSAPLSANPQTPSLPSPTVR
ncbi:MAG: hypothetical protein HY290_10085 [Planctomycetia bacterium]|nr:hypothetical protein [Planctomycetia bacterium]